MAKRDTSTEKKPNILIIWGMTSASRISAVFTKGVMGYRTPNIDRIANEGMLFTDYYAEQSCTAGRAAFITGQSVFRTGLSKVGLPGRALGMRAEDPTIAELLKPLGYATGQFGKNHLGDRDEHLPTMHGFDEFFGNLYHLNAEEEPELRDYPPEKDFPNFRKNYGPRGCAALLGRRPKRRAEDREHRSADQKADGDRGRGIPGRGQGVHQAPAEGAQTVLCLVQHHPHAFPHAREAQKPGPVGALAIRISRRHDRPRQARRRDVGLARRTGDCRKHVCDVQHRQRAAHELLAGRGHDAFPQREELQLGRRLPRAGDGALAGQDQSRLGLQRDRQPHGLAADVSRYGRRARHQGEAQEGP